jgi:hypothetical protein
MQIIIPVHFEPAHVEGASAAANAVAQLFTDPERVNVVAQAAVAFPADPSAGVVNVTLNVTAPGLHYLRRYISDSQATPIGAFVDSEYTVPSPNTFVAV